MFTDDAVPFFTALGDLQFNVSPVAIDSSKVGASSTSDLASANNRQIQCACSSDG